MQPFPVSDALLVACSLAVFAYSAYVLWTA